MPRLSFIATRRKTNENEWLPQPKRAHTTLNRPYYSWKRNLVSGEFPGGSTVTSYLPRILVIDISANVRTTLKMKDAQGNWRGRCNSSGCQCDFFLSEDADCSACDYCGHPPTDHDIMTLGPCTSCGQCSEYVEDAGEEGKCSYCGCTPADHGRRNCVTITLYIVHARLVCSIPLYIYTELHCKLPGCTKPRCVEGDRIYDFCGRSHAKQYLMRKFDTNKYVTTLNSGDAWSF